VVVDVEVEVGVTSDVGAEVAVSPGKLAVAVSNASTPLHEMRHKAITVITQSSLCILLLPSFYNTFPALPSSKRLGKQIAFYNYALGSCDLAPFSRTVCKE
jgi:hypothetical protein